MSRVEANGLGMGYDIEGSGDPLVLIPYLAADRACYAFQVPEFSKRFTCICLDPRGAGESDKPAGEWSTELFADDVAAFMDAIGVERAHVFGLSLGGAVGLWLAAKHPGKVRSLSIHSAWHVTDPFLRAVVGGWRVLAEARGSIHEMVIHGILPWCFTPETYGTRAEMIESIHGFVRSRPEQPVDAFMRQSAAVLSHDVSTRLSEIAAPTQLGFGGDDRLTSTRFADPLVSGIPGAELAVFEGCAHAPIYEKAEEFNRVVLDFLQRSSA